MLSTSPFFSRYYSEEKRNETFRKNSYSVIPMSNSRGLLLVSEIKAAEMFDDTADGAYFVMQLIKECQEQTKRSTKSAMLPDA